MIGTVIDEVKASATADLPGHITAVATLRGVSLTSTFELNDWWEEEAEMLRTLNPWALGIRWEDTVTRSAQRSFASHKHFDHRLHLVGAYKGTDIDIVKRHMLYLPEAVVRWLSNFPISSRSSGKTIQQIDPPESGGGITIEHDLVLTRPVPPEERKPVLTTYVWAFDVAVTVHASDAT